MYHFFRQTSLLGPRNSVNTLVFSPDGDFLASGDDDGTIHIYDVQDDWEVAHKISGPTRATALLWASQENKLFLYAGFGDGMVLITHVTRV